MSDFKKKLAEARLPERTVQVCLRGDLVADHEQAERDLEQAQNRASDSLTGGGTGPIVERIEALEAEMREHTETFRLRALPKPQWRALVNAHPPRRDEKDEIVEADKEILLNTETFYEDLIRRCVVEPVLDDEDWAQLLDVITDHQFGMLSWAAWLLNRGEIDVPFSRAASRAKRATAAE